MTSLPGIPKTTRRAPRPLYKAERRPDVPDGVVGQHPPVGVPDASRFEVTAGIVAVCMQMGIKPGRGGGYDKQRDEYVIVGKSGRWARPQEYKIPGHLVSMVITGFRGAMGATRPLETRNYLKTPKVINFR